MGGPHLQLGMRFERERILDFVIDGLTNGRPPLVAHDYRLLKQRNEVWTYKDVVYLYTNSSPIDETDRASFTKRRQALNAAHRIVTSIRPVYASLDVEQPLPSLDPHGGWFFNVYVRKHDLTDPSITSAPCVAYSRDLGDYVYMSSTAWFTKRKGLADPGYERTKEMSRLIREHVRPTDL